MSRRHRYGREDRSGKPKGPGATQGKSRRAWSVGVSPEEIIAAEERLASLLIPLPIPTSESSLSGEGPEAIEVVSDLPTTRIAELGQMALQQPMMLPAVLKTPEEILSPKHLWMGRYVEAESLEPVVSLLGQIVRDYGHMFILPDPRHYRLEYLSTATKKGLVEAVRQAPTEPGGETYGRLANHMENLWVAPDLDIPPTPIRSLISRSIFFDNDRERCSMRFMFSDSESVTQNLLQRVTGHGEAGSTDRIKLALGEVRGLEAADFDDFWRTVKDTLRSNIPRVPLKAGPMIMGYGSTKPHLSMIQEIYDLDQCRRW